MDKNIRVVKEIDSLGRIVIPKDFRERMMLEKSVEVILTTDGVLIRNPKYKLVQMKDDSKKHN